MFQPLNTPRDKIHAWSHTSRISLSIPILFSALLALSLATWSWPKRWILSGTPLLVLVVLLGASKGYRVLPFLPLWSIIIFLNISYAIAATSWLLYWLLTAAIYPSLLLTCIFQFDLVARFVRRCLRAILSELHFVHDTIGFFDIPALEIDVDVEGLMVVRGLTFSLSSFTIVAHGVELGIKLAEDLELAICTDKVTVALFRRIEISDCYANLKGGAEEMTFEGVSSDEDEDSYTVMVEATALLQAAEATGDKSRPRLVKMKSEMTGGANLKPLDATSGWTSVRKLSPEDKRARDEYDQTLRWIKESSSIYQCRKDIGGDKDTGVRAAVCSKMHSMPSVPHPPKRSIKVTTLQSLLHPRVRRLLHRMPMLLRLILNPISYFHPVSVESISGSGSGRWIAFTLQKHLFEDYADDNKQLRRLEKRILSWLADANFVVELPDIQGIAAVPFLSTYDIQTLLKCGDAIAYRTVDETQEEIIRLGGADAQFIIPSFLLPHHEHLLPPIATEEGKEQLSKQVDEADGKPNEILAKRRLQQAEDDEANVQFSAHVKLPAVFSQELLNFIAALVKATKVVELEKEPDALEEKISGIKEFGQALSKSMKNGMRKTVVDGMINDRWIAKMVGKITKLLEQAQGDAGYIADIPVKLEKYRLPLGHAEMRKILQ